MHLPPITIDYRSPPPHKRVRYTPYLIPAAISVASENYVSTLTNPSGLLDLLPTDDPNTLHDIKKDVPFKGRVHGGYCCRKHSWIRCYKKTRFYWSTCSNEDKIFYYCHGFPKVSLATSNFFLEHQHSMSLRYGWLLCLSPFHTLLYLLNLFCACFLPVPMITPCIVFVDCLNACDDSPVIQLSCTGNLHSYDRQLKKGIILWKRKKNHCLLNPSTPIRYKILLLTQKFMLLP